MKLGLLLHDPEEEHDCFSDNTYNSHYYDAHRHRGTSTSAATAGSTARWSRARASPSSCAAKDPALDAEMRAKLDATQAAMRKMKEPARQRVGPTTR